MLDVAAQPSAQTGLTSAEAERRLAGAGPNAVAAHRVRAVDLLLRQLRDPFLLLLSGGAAASLALGERTDAAIILAIVVLSVGLTFVNEYRSASAVADLQRRVRMTAIVMRDGLPVRLDAAKIVPGDLVALDVGDIVPADLRLVEAISLSCDESTLTGEAEPAEKQVLAGSDADAFMGTVVRSGTGRGIVTATGHATRFGRIAERTAALVPETAFQRGLRDLSGLLLRFAATLGAIVFVVKVAAGQPPVDTLVFTLAIVVGLTPQLLPAIVTVSLATGARSLARRQVLVKRLITIEDLGNLEVLFCDKTGTLTAGRLEFLAAIDAAGTVSPPVLRYGLICNQAVRTAGGVGGNPLDVALWEASRGVPVDGARKLDALPFDYARRMMSVLVDDGGRRFLITKGAPEDVLSRCAAVAPALRSRLEQAFDAGSRVVAIATKELPGCVRLVAADENDLVPAGLLIFRDPVKIEARDAVARLAALHVTVKVITGDNERVARATCTELGIPVTGVLTGRDLATLQGEALRRAIEATTIFARIDPEQKSAIINAQRAGGRDVGFIGDGINDAIALHDADVGISVDSASDVAKDAADVVLVTKDLGILADGIVEGRRVFANTIKYIVMGTSSNLGNVISTAIGSLILPFLPLLPSQILLNNLLYDVSEMSIPTDRVDDEQLRRPEHWDIALVRRYALVFGPISSVFDLATFAVLLLVMHAAPATFQAGFFAESIVTQTVVVFALRTRRVPFFRSRPGTRLAVTTLAVAALGLALPFSPLGAPLGFTRLPAGFAVFVGLVVLVYVGLIEAAKAVMFRLLTPSPRVTSVVRPGR